jgi:hypothetical protein
LPHSTFLIIGVHRFDGALYRHRRLEAFMSRNLMPSPKLHEVIVAMNEHPWTRFTLTDGRKDVPSYCALAALLRHAGVPHERINYVALSNESGPLLSAKYGISDAETVHRIVAANDGAATRAEAIWRVLGVISGVADPDDSAPGTGAAYGGPELPPAA